MSPPLAAQTRVSVVPAPWVAAHRADPDVLILDVRADSQAYAIGHVPQATHFPEDAVRRSALNISGQYLPAAPLAERLSQAGLRGDRVVVYSDGDDVLGATMVAYALERMGYPEVLIMDGGWTRYQGAYALSQVSAAPTVRARVPVRKNASVGVSLDQVKALIGVPHVKFVDARLAQAFQGDMTTPLPNGHIPGAVNIPWHEFMDRLNSHKFRSLGDMRQLIAEKGIADTDDVIVYCTTGREATLVYVAMKHLLGFPRVRVYEGSWVEYSAQPNVKIETSPIRIAAR